MSPLPSPYEAPESYDLVLDTFREDLGFWLDEARRARGPVLEVTCGTGRVLLHLLENGIDADGVDLFTPMLDRLRSKARSKGLEARAYAADMRDFTTPRRYGRVFIPFNGFAHCEAPEDQLACLRCCRDHLEPDGALVVDMSFPGARYWTGPEGIPVLEMEVPHPQTGRPVRMFDTRRKDRVGQWQHSVVEIVELGAEGQPDRVQRFETRQRWVYRFELELLFREAGFARCEILGSWERRPLENDTDQMLAFAWRT